MSFASLLNQTVNIYRLAPTTGSKKQYALVGTTKIMIAPMSANAADINKMSFARAFDGFVPTSTNVLIGDYLQDSSGNKYDVQGARNYTMGTQPFIQLSLQKQTQQGEI